jgi:hypothetical protein
MSKKPILTPEARAKLAAAMKARWAAQQKNAAPKTETLHDCPQCGTKNFTAKGLASHNCAKHAARRDASLAVARNDKVLTGVPAGRKALTITPAPGDPHAIELSALDLVPAPTVSEEFGQARIYVHALEGMAHGMAAIAVVLGAELQRLHGLFGVRAGRPSANSRSRSEISWPDLVDRELGISDDTARNWMHLAEQARKRLPDFAPVAEKLLATPLGALPDLQRAELVEKTRKLLPEESARQLMLDWGIAKKPKARGGNTTPKDGTKAARPNKATSAQATYHGLQELLFKCISPAAIALMPYLPAVTDEPDKVTSLTHLLEFTGTLRTALQDALKIVKGRV